MIALITICGAIPGESLVSAISGLSALVIGGVGVVVLVRASDRGVTCRNGTVALDALLAVCVLDVIVAIALLT
jgi:hypothetical protein